MVDRGQGRDLRPVSGVMFGLAGAGAIALIVGLAAFSAPQSARALPAYAQQTKLACGRCHVSAAGGGALTAFGKAFAANGHKVPAKSTKPAEPGKRSETVTPGKESVPVRASSSPWAAPRRCNGWCLRRD
jgi:hypothetical protein